MNDPADRWDSPLSARHTSTDPPIPAFFRALATADADAAELAILRAAVNDTRIVPEWKLIANGIGQLVDRYQAYAADSTQQQAITNLASLLRHASAFAGALCRDIYHYREEVAEAREQARQAQDRVVDLLEFNVIDVVHLANQLKWSLDTFGPGERTEAITNHIAKELGEIREHPGDLYEWVDVIILGFNGAMRAGWKPQQVIDAIVAKQAENEQRTWPDWRTADPDKPIEHVRDEAR